MAKTIFTKNRTKYLRVKSDDGINYMSLGRSPNKPRTLTCRFHGLITYKPFPSPNDEEWNDLDGYWDGWYALVNQHKSCRLIIRRKKRP